MTYLEFVFWEDEKIVAKCMAYSESVFWEERWKNSREPSLHIYFLKVKPLFSFLVFYLLCNIL